MAETNDQIHFDDGIERSGVFKSRSRSETHSHRMRGPSQRPVSVDEKEVDSVFDDAIPAIEDRDFKRKQVENQSAVLMLPTYR